MEERTRATIVIAPGPASRLMISHDPVSALSGDAEKTFVKVVIEFLVAGHCAPRGQNVVRI